MLSRTSRILFVVALLAAGTYFLLVRPHDRAQEHGAETNDVLASFDAASIDSITLERPQDTLVFSRASNMWRLTSPVADSAEPGAIGTLLDALNTADINRNLGMEKNLSPYGLDHPDAVVTLLSRHAVVLHVAIGKNTVDDAWCYAHLASGNVCLIPTDVHHSSTLPRDEYRNHRVLDFEVKDVTGYEIRSAARTMRWTRSGRRWFALAGRDTVLGDSVAAAAPLHRLRGLRVSSFVAGADTSTASADSVRIMTVTMGPKGRAVLRFHRADSAWQVGDGTRFITVADDVADLFSHSVNELRDRRLLQFDPALTRRINFAAPSTTGELVRAGGRWSFPNPAMGRVEPERAADFVRALRALKWSQPGSEAARTTGRVYYRIEIMGDRDTMIDQLTGGPYDASTSWVTSRSSRGTWLVENARLDEVSKYFARLKER